MYGFHMTGNTDMHLLVMDTLLFFFKLVRGFKKKYLVWPPFASCSASPSHRLDRAGLLIVVCGMLSHSSSIAVRSFWIFLFIYFTFIYIGGNWNTLSIQSIPNLLNGWHVWWVYRPWKNWDMFSFQELCTDPCDKGSAFSCWKRRWWRRINGTTMGLRISPRYLCAFKLPSITCNYVHCPYLRDSPLFSIFT